MTAPGPPDAQGPHRPDPTSGVPARDPSATDRAPGRHTGRPRTGRGHGIAQGLAGAAVLIGAVTIVARAVGFARNLVFARTVGTDCLATAYFTGNQVTNILFEIVAGGALAGMVVPVLAGPAHRAAPEAARIASALITWTVVILVPLSALAALLAPPIITVLASGVGECSPQQVIAVGTRMLVVFAPQIALYGLAVVLYGVLQAHRRFLGPALAPLVSSLVVIGAYLMFAVTGQSYRAATAAGQDDLSLLSTAGELTLSLGTTGGVLAMVLTVAGPVARLRLRLRPTLSFPPGVAARIRRLAMAGMAALIAQQAAWSVVIVLANSQGGAGALAVYQYAWALFQLPYAVLAVPLATSAFTALSAQAGHEADPARTEDPTEPRESGPTGPAPAATTTATTEFNRTAAATTRAVVLLSCGGAAVLAATALPVARIFLLGTVGDAPPGELADAIVAFAPGLVGYGLIAHTGRALYACGRGRASAVGQVTGWLAVIAAEVALALTAARDDVVAALGWGNTAGLTLGGVLLLAFLARVRGRSALAGLGRALLAGTLGAGAGYAAGALIVAAVGPTGLAGGIAVAIAAAVATAAVFLAVTSLVDGPDIRAVLTRRRAAQ